MDKIKSWWFSGNEHRGLDGAKNDCDDDSEYFSATDDSESTGSSVHITEQTSDSQNSQLMLSIRRRDSEEVLEAMDESNKWILQQQIWYLDKKENLLEENGLSLVEDEEKVFLEQCIETYLSSGPDNVTENEEISSETAIETETSNFKINPKLFEISINSNVPDVEYQTAETNVSRSLDDQIVDDSNTPSVKFFRYFRLLLENKFSHFSEEQIFGTPGDTSDIVNSIILNEFESLKECDTLEHFQDILSRWTVFSTVTEEIEGQLKSSFSDFFNKTCKDLEARQQIRKSILDELETFCFCLIDTRAKTMHLFEQFECKLYQQIISFEFLSTDCCSFKCALNMLFKELEEGVSVECCEKISIIQKLQDRHSSCSLECNKEAEENRLDVYQEEVKLYQKLLKVISTQTQVQVDTTVLEQILKSKENHFSYLHENLTRLVKLLLQIVLPYSIFSQSRDGSTVYTIKMVAGLSSRALSVFDEWISRNKPTETLQSGDEIRLCADAVLYADSDVYHHGVSVVCIALKLICKKVSPTTSDETASSVSPIEGTKQCVTINTKGKHIKFSDRPIKARPGEDGTETAKDGKPGVDGENGQYGNAGGHVLLVASNICISDFNLLASGSPGGDGQNGGDGGAGWTPTVKGIDGNNAPEFEAGRLQTNSSVVISFGTRGVDSGHGGDAGMGGAAGKSGVSGKIEILDIDNEWNCHVTQNQVKDSKPGQPGDPGKGGKHTRHGMDYGRYGKSLLFWARVVTLVTSTRPTDSIDNYSGELCHDEILYDRSIPHPNVEQYEKPARDKIPMQVKKNDHPDFVNRGCNRDGETAKIKVNNSLANENKAVDKQACFYAFHEQCRQSLQHWNCKSHNRFLGAFARKVGEIHDTEFMSITRSEANRSKCVIWMSQFHKLSENMKVSVTCEAKQSTKVQISLMKDYTNEVTYSTYPSADNYLGSESIETESLSVNVSSLKQRAEHKNIHLENYLLESLLTDDCFDDEIEKLQATLNLSEEIIYFVRCDTTADTVNTRFLITQNLQTNTWIFCHPSGTHKMTVNSSLEVLTMEKNQLTPLNRDTMISYEEIVNWICGNIDEDIELPATTEQLLCLKQLKLIILIRKSYKNVCDNCSTEEIDLVQKMYAVCLDTLVGSKSLSALLRMQDFLNSEGLLLTVFDLNWIKSMLPLTYEDETAINAFFDAVGNYNREQHLDLLLYVMVTFQDYHIEMLKTPDYIDYLAKHEFKLFLQTFKESLTHAFHFLCGKFNLASRFQHFAIFTTKSETILQKFAIKGRARNQTHGHLKAYIGTMLHKKQSMTFVTAVEHMLSSVIETVAKLLGIVLTIQEQSLATVKINLSFPEAYSAFCAFPSLETVLPALVAISGKLSGDFAKDFQEILSFTYSEVSDVLRKFHELMYVDDFKSLMSKIGLETVDFIKALCQPSIDIAKSQLEALTHILNYILKITLEPNSHRSSVPQDPSRLLISVMKFLKGMCSYYNSLFHIPSDDEDRQSKIELRNQLIKKDISKIAEFHATLLAYPMSCPLMALIKWKEFIDLQLLEKLELKLKLFKNTSENDVLENLSELKIELRNFNNFLVLVIDSRNNFEVFKSCKDLQMYSLLYKADTDKLPVVLTTDIMGLEKLNGECMRTIVTHFGQCFLSSSQFQLSVEMERLEPNYEFLISSEEPLANIKPYTLILVINGSKWKLYYSSDCSSCHWRDVELSEIEQIKEVLDSKLDPFVVKNGHFSLTKEQKAYLVSMFKFDSEYSVSYRVHFGSQLLLSKTQACSLSMLSIDIKTCAVKISDGTVLEDDDSIGQSILVVLCNSTSSEALENLKCASAYLKISEDQFTSEIEGTVGVIVVKYPDQPAIVKTVTKCGEKEVLKHHYSLSLYRDDLSGWSLLSNSSDACTYRLLLNDSSERNGVTLFDVLQPISELLKIYQELYDTLLPTQILNNSLKSAVELCPTVCCRQHIINFVRCVRRDFVQECMNLLIDDSNHKNVQTIRKAMESMLFPYSSVLIEDVHLLAIENFLYFQLVMKNQKSTAKVIQLPHIREVSSSFRFWEKVQVMKTFTTEEVVSICRAFVYLQNSLYVENVLDCEIGYNRFKWYQTIHSGLQLLPGDIVDEQIIFMVSDHLKACDLERYVKEDGENNEALLRVMKTNESLWNFVGQYSSETAFTTGSFGVYLSQLILTWFKDELYNIFQLLQNTVLSDLFSCHTKKNILLNTFTCCLCSRADQALENPAEWDSLIGLVEVSRTFVHDLNVRVRKILNIGTSDSECPDLLQHTINMVRLVKESPDVLMVVSIVQEYSSDMWLSHLLAYNLFELCVIQYNNDDVDDLHAKMPLIDQTFLQILYNVFINDVSNASASTISSFSFEQLCAIVDLLPYIEPCPAAFSVLCRNSIFCWEKEIQMIHFKQYLDQWKELSATDKQRTIYMMNRVRLDSGMTHIKFMLLLYKIRSKYTRGNAKDSKLLMSAFEALYYKQISLEQLNNIAGNQWSRSIRTLLSITTARKCLSRNANDVVDLIHNQLQVESGDSELGICDFTVIRNEAREVLQHLEHCSMIPNATERELKQFVSLLQRHVTIEDRMQWLETHRVPFVSSIIKSWILSSVSGSDVQQVQIPYSTQMISLLLFLHSRNKGLLQQVKTGEGKTLIVGMLAGAKALLGFNVDVVSSNRDLAQSGMEKCQPFFRVLGLKAAINCTDDDDTNQQAYKVHIVYGDVGSFQRDVLQEESEPGVKVNFKNRYSEPEKNCLIVDEVDSMFLDKAQHMLYLSHDSPALKHLETLFLHIWSAMISVSSTHVENVSARLIEIAKHMNTLIKDDTIPVPDYLKVFCEKKMESWVKSAYHAMTMDANDQFVIDNQKQGNSEVKRIFPIDKQTGIEQYNMKWSNGLSQFLELKYRRPISSENLKAIFISNKRFFQKYGKQLFGLTGTIGSITSRKLLQKVYGIITVELPTNKPKLYAQRKSRIATSEQDWSAQICDEISIRASEQPVLVICENIKHLECIKRYMLSQGTISENNIISYARDGDNIEKKFKDQHGAKPGQIVLATNKGGRGTDIVISDEDAPKGLHVILTFLPDNTRIEEQAFGRAARAGQAGSGCLIIHVNQQNYESLFQRFESVEAGTEILVEMEKAKRDKAEANRLSVLLSDGLPRLELEEQLYLWFQKCRNLFTVAVQNLSLMNVQVGRAAISTLIGVVTDHWAYWLDSMHAQIHSVSSESEKQLVINLFSKEFPAQGYPLPSSINDTNFFKHPESYVTLGIGFLRDITESPSGNNIESQHLHAALACFEHAEKSGDLTGLPAMASCYCFIKLNPDASKTNTKQARRYLKKARTHLMSLKQTLMVNAEVGTKLIEMIDVSQYIHDDENYYTHQVEEKMKVLGLHLHTVELLLGNIIDEHSFVNGSTLTEEKISEEQSKKIYHKLVTLGFVYHNKVRKYWKNETVLKKLILEKVDEQVSVALIELVLNKPVINESDLIGLVNSSDELWDIVSPLLEMSVNVRVIVVSKIDSAILESDRLNIWNEFKNSFETDRIDLPLDDERTDTYKDFLAYLERKNLCTSTKKGLLKQDSVIMMENLDLGKYKNCYMYNKGHKQTLRSYLSSLFEYCQQNEDCFLLEYMLPYGNKAFEAQKMHAFLQEQDILKSGQLVQHKYGVGKELQHAIATSLRKEYPDLSPFQIDFIVRILGRLQGELRKFERKMHVDFVDFYDLPDRPEERSEELAFFTACYMDQFLSIEQADKGYWDWNAFACATLGMAQVIGGATLLSLGVTASIGSALIAEGVNDMVYATMAGLTGTFTWNDYAIHKSISLALTIATGGISALASLASPVKIVSKLGSATPFSAFIKATAGAAKKFVYHAVTTYISDVVLEEVQERVVHATIESIEKRLISKCREGLHSRLKNLAQQVNSDDEFHSKCQRIVSNMRTSLGMNTLLPAEFDLIRSQVGSLLQSNYKSIAEKLGNSNSTTVRLLSKGVKVAYYANKAISVVKAGVKLGGATVALLDLFKGDFNLSPECVRQAEDIDESLIKRNAEEIEACLIQFIRQQLHEKIRMAVHYTVKRSLNGIAKASKIALASAVKKASTQTITEHSMTSISENDKQARVSNCGQGQQDHGQDVKVGEMDNNLDLQKRDTFLSEIPEPTVQTADGNDTKLDQIKKSKKKKKKKKKLELVVHPPVMLLSTPPSGPPPTTQQIPLEIGVAPSIDKKLQPMAVMKILQKWDKQPFSGKHVARSLGDESLYARTQKSEPQKCFPCGVATPAPTQFRHFSHFI